MTYEDEARWRREQEDARSARSAGTVTNVNWSLRLVEVDLGGARQWMAWASTAPFVGDVVRVIWAGQEPTAFAAYGSPMGTVQSIVGSLARVLGDDGVMYEWPHISGSAPSAGHRVALLHQHRMVSSRYSAEPPGSQLSTPSQPGGGRTATFYPTESGSWRDGAFRGPLCEVNVNRTGVYYYGSQLASSLGGATPKKLLLTLREDYDNVSGTPSLVGAHSKAGSGDGAVSISGVVPVDGSGTWDITALASAFAGGALGVGFQIDTGYRAFESYATSGALYAEW